MVKLDQKRKDNRDGRLLNLRGLKHYRRSYSVAEFCWGLVVLCVLMAISGWVIYRGKHPDAALFSDGTELLQHSKVRVVVPKTEVQVVSGDSKKLPAWRAEADRLFPPDLASIGWEQRPTSHFTSETLYEKINGRASYFEAFGFKQLFFTTLIHSDTQSSIDLELYDLGASENALGAYTGELTANAQPGLDEGGMSHISRNAMFLSRGRYYLRAIGSDEGKLVQAKLDVLRSRFVKQIEGSQLPWAYGLFVAYMSLKPSDISYVRENAFSFEFAYDVYQAKIDENSYLFISAQTDAKIAEQLSKKYVEEGFLSYGEKVEDEESTATKEGSISRPVGKIVPETQPGNGVAHQASTAKIVWVQDRYINTYATAIAVERWVIGVQGVTTLQMARNSLKKLHNAVSKMPESLRSRAIPSTAN